MKYAINKGIGSSVEFQGLKAQYLFIFAGGLLGIFIFVIILYMIGVYNIVCIVLGVLLSTLLVWQTFSLNKKYGTHGLMKMQSVKNRPRYIINRRRISKIFKLYHRKT